MLAAAKKRGIGINGDEGQAARVRTAIDVYSGLTQRDIARALGITPQSITKWRNKGYISKEHIPAFCRVCNVSVEWLLSGHGDPQDPNPLTNLTNEQIAEAIAEELPPARQAELLQLLIAQFSKVRDKSE
jgi:transcriptional regulator with XRE-family HTH domain